MTIICDSMTVASAVTFDKNVRVRSVTLDGDTVDPAGTLSGGAKNSLGTLLIKMKVRNMRHPVHMSLTEHHPQEFSEVSEELRRH
jgi:structural maintenance of chromosome 2